jgi:hypothetical protein
MWRALNKVYALINPLHGEIDRQLLDQRLPDDLPDDAELDVLITRKHERDLSAAVLLIEQFQRSDLKSDLDIAYERINAIGSPDSAEDPNNQFAKGINHAVDAALKIIDEARSGAVSQSSYDNPDQAKATHPSHGSTLEE